MFPAPPQARGGAFKISAISMKFSMFTWGGGYPPPCCFISASSTPVYFRLKPTNSRSRRYHSRSALSKDCPRLSLMWTI